MKWNDDIEKAINAVENGEGAKHGRDARKYAVDTWKVHIGEIPKSVVPKDWKDPYAHLDENGKPKAKTTKAKAKAKK